MKNPGDLRALIDSRPDLTDVFVMGGDGTLNMAVNEMKAWSPASEHRQQWYGQRFSKITARHSGFQKASRNSHHWKNQAF
jgi:hypothetical protein